MKDFAFTTKSYHDIHGTVWHDVPKAKGIVQIIHNFKGHMYKYDKLASFLVSQGYIPFGMDCLGHGRNYDDVNKSYMFDVKNGKKEAIEAHVEAAKKMKKKYGLPVFLLGDGMGSYMARHISYTTDFKYAGYIFVGTSFKKSSSQAGGTAGLQRKIKGPNEVNPKVVSKFWEGILETEKFNFTDKIDWLTSNMRMVFEASKDPFLQIPYSLSAINDISYWMKESMEKSNIKKMNPKTPVLIQSGKKDIVNNNSVEKLGSLLSSVGIKKVKVKTYRQAKHDLYNEPDAEDYLFDLVNWLDVFSL